MRTRRPDKRSFTIKQRYEAKLPLEGTSPIDAAYYDVLAKGVTDNASVTHACEIAANEYETEILNAFMLAGATDQQLETHFRIPQDVSRAYRHLFFDPSHFRDELDVYSWVREQESAKDVSQHAISLLKQALSTGVDGLLWVYSRVKTPVDPSAVIQDVLMHAYMRAKQHRAADIKSAAGKEAHTHMGTAMKAASMLIQHAATASGNSNGVSDLLIKLGHRELTTSVDETDKDILN